MESAKSKLEPDDIEVKPELQEPSPLPFGNEVEMKVDSEDEKKVLIKDEEDQRERELGISPEAEPQFPSEPMLERKSLRLRGKSEE